MPTNEERKETAKSLYELTKYGTGVPVWHVHLILGLIDDDNYVHGTVLTNDSVVRLADLIEPEPDRTCHLEETDHAYETSFRCDACNRVVWVDFKGNIAPKYCPNCGAKVIQE